MDTVRLLISVPERLTPENSPFKTFSRNLKNFPQSWLFGKDYEKEYGLYFPTVSYLERPVSGGITHDLSIEFSAPKLIFNGDNLREVSELDYGKVISTLQNRLHKMGFDYITYDMIANSIVSRLDVCKNIPLDKKSDIFSLFQVLRLGNMGGAYQPIGKPYPGGGQSFGYGTKHETVTFYDKGAEMRHSGKMPKFSNESIIRFEVKMNNPRLIKERLKKIGFVSDDGQIRFVDVFRNEVWRRLVNDRYLIWHESTPFIDLDASLPQMYMNIARNEVGKRGGYTRTNEQFAWYVLATRCNLNGAELESLVESLWGRNYKYRVRKLKNTTIKECQLQLLIKLKRELNEFKFLDESDVNRIKGG